jgi:hypothetical protein
MTVKKPEICPFTLFLRSEVIQSTITPYIAYTMKNL